MEMNPIGPGKLKTRARTLGGVLIILVLVACVIYALIPPPDSGEEQHYLHEVAKAAVRYKNLVGSLPKPVQVALSDTYGYHGDLTYHGSEPRLVWLSPDEWAVCLDPKGVVAITSDGTPLVISEYNWDVDREGHVLDSGYNWWQYKKSNPVDE